MVWSLFNEHVRSRAMAVLVGGALAMLIVSEILLPVMPSARWRALLLAVIGIAELLWIVAVLVRFERARRMDLEASHRTASAQLDLVWAVGHELRNPLTMVKASTAILRSQAPGELNSEQQRFVGVIEQQTMQGIAICEDLLAQARMSAGTFAVELRPVNLMRVVREVGAGMRAVLDQRHQRILYSMPRLMDDVAADRRAIVQILTNLLMNASRHSGDGAAIEVMLRDNDNAVILQVTDAGSGMSPAERARAFEPFRTGAIGSDGTGLGLSIARNLVDAHGGRIYVDTRLATGTAFMVMLPKRDLDTMDAS